MIGTLEDVELSIIKNDGAFYRGYVEHAIARMKEFIRSGKYSKTKAPKLWLYVVQAAIAQYRRQVGALPKFSEKEKLALAAELAQEYYGEIKRGNF